MEGDMGMDDFSYNDQQLTEEAQELLAEERVNRSVHRKNHNNHNGSMSGEPYPLFLIHESMAYSYERNMRRKRGEWFTSDLTSCPRKREFAKQYPKRFFMNDKMLNGIIIHLGLQYKLKQKYPRGRKEIEVSKRAGTKMVYGHPDFLRDDAGIVYEIKAPVYWSEDRDKPYKSYIKQTRLYMWMTGITEAWVYVSASNYHGRYKIRQRPYTTSDVVDMLETARHPTSFDIPMYPQFECEHCMWETICSHKDN